MRGSRHHLGLGFENWRVPENWFWLVLSPDGDGGAIGAAATEAHAVRDARLSIEEMTARYPGTLPAAARNPSQPAYRGSDSIMQAVMRWEVSFANLQRYLTGLDSATA